MKEEPNDMSYFIDSLKNLCEQYNVEITSLCDARLGTPVACVHKIGDDDNYYSADIEKKSEIRIGERIQFVG